MGVAVQVEGLTKSFGSQNTWSDVTLTLPPGEISVLLGPSGTGKSVFLESLVPGRRAVRLDGPVRQHRLPAARAHEEGRVRGPPHRPREDGHGRPAGRREEAARRDLRRLRKRAGLARALVLDPEIILFDEPDSGLDPVRVAYLNQLIVDLNAQIDATFLIVTHDIGTARTVPDNLGLLYRKHLAMFGPCEQLLTSQEPVVQQFLNGRREGLIGMSEEKDVAQVEAEMAALQARGGDRQNGVGPKGAVGGDAVPPQLDPSPGLPERRVQRRRQERVARMLHDVDPATADAIRASLPEDLLAQVDAGVLAPTAGAHGRHWDPTQAVGVLPGPRDGR